MVVGGLLEALGVPGTIVLAVMAVLGFYHLRQGLTLASLASHYLQIIAVIGVALVLAMAGVIPGVELDVGAKFFATLEDLAAEGYDLVKVVL